MNAPRDFSVLRRATGRRVSAIVGTASLGLAGYVAATQSIPEFHVYDGVWMLLWGTIAVGAIAPLVWPWRRERSLAAVVTAGFLGCWAPLIVSALRHQIPVMARLKGSVMLAGAGVVGIAAPFGFLCLWLALKEHSAS